MAQPQTQQPQRRETGGKREDAIALLTEDHKEVKKLFKEFEKLKEDEGSDAEKEEIAEKICEALKAHATVEEEIFYPAVREATGEDDLMDEAEVEHASAKDLIAQIEASGPGDELWEAKVTVLGEYIDHHVKEEQDEMFPKARKARIDLMKLGAEIAERKLALETE